MHTMHTQLPRLAPGLPPMQVPVINCTDLKRMLDDPLMAQTVVVVDVRGPEEVRGSGVEQVVAGWPVLSFSFAAPPVPRQGVELSAVLASCSLRPDGQHLLNNDRANAGTADGGQHDSRQPDHPGV